YYINDWLKLDTQTTWLNDYNTGRQLAAAQKLPMAVVFGTGPRRQDLHGVFASQYISVYVDVRTPSGRALADSCGINGLAGLILTVRSLNNQAFCHQGSLANVPVAQYLRKYADPLTVVDTTETVAVRGNLARATPATAVAPAQVAGR